MILPAELKTNEPLAWSPGTGTDVWEMFRAAYVTYYTGSGTPLKNVAAAGQLEIVRLLLARVADPNLAEEGIAPRGHALYAAVANGQHEIARLLLDHGAYPNPEVEGSADALSRAISNSDPRMIELLCSYDR